MYTIHQGINGGWYGSASADTPEDTLDAARELARILAQLKAELPRSAHRQPDALEPPSTPGINAKGAACLAYCKAHPRSTHTEYTAAGHTQRTVKWLREHGYLQDINGLWVVTDSPAP